MPKRDSMGRVVVILLPIAKLKIKSPRRVPFKKEIHAFLSKNFSGYTVASGNITGYWKDQEGRGQFSKHFQYRVALPPAKTARATLEKFLAVLAREMDETCIYMEHGDEAFLIYASKAP